MAVDYDAPRQTPADDTEDELSSLAVRRSTSKAGTADVDDTPDVFNASEIDAIDEELSVPVVPMRADEFRCSRCFLVHHRSRLADPHGTPTCRDCS